MAINKNTLKIALAGFAALQLGLVQNAHANVDRNGKRVDIIVDNQFYGDAEVMDALEKYTTVIEEKYGFTINTYSFEKAPLAGITQNSLDKARQLKNQLQGSYNSQWNGKLEGAIFVGSLPKATMESWSGRWPYDAFQTDFYFMDLNGNWGDHFGNTCGPVDGEEVCNKIGGGNGILESHSDNGNSDPFEIWVSRIDPYSAINPEEADYDLAKFYLINWLVKATAQQKTNERYHGTMLAYNSASFYHATPPLMQMEDALYEMSYTTESPKVIRVSKDSDYMYPIILGNDWVTFMGGGTMKSIASVQTNMFVGQGLTVIPRVFHFTSNDAAASYDDQGNLVGASIAPVHIFTTQKGGVSAVASMNHTDGELQAHLLEENMPGKLLGEAFLAWINQKVLENDYDDPLRIYDNFYSQTLMGDPFVSTDPDDKYVETVVAEKGAFMTFDDPSNPWTSTQADLTYDADEKIGDEGYSLAVTNGKNGSNKDIKSPKFSNNEIEANKNLLLDVYVPANQYWYGGVQMKLDIPSASVYSMWIDGKELSNQNGGWATVKFQLQDQVLNALKGKYKDAQFTITLISNNTEVPYRLDNLRFAPAEQPKPEFRYATYGNVVRGTSNASAIRVDGRSVNQVNATSSMTIQKK